MRSKTNSQRIFMTKLAADQIAWLENALRYAGDGCLIWPFYRLRGGYGKTTNIDGKQHLAHRLICEWVNGDPPTPKHEAAHSCGLGHEGCVTPKHLSWKTNIENKLDRHRHGTAWMNGQQKLGPAEVQKIRRLKGKKKQHDIAAMFGVSQANISLIQSGKGWSSLSSEI